MTKEWVCTPSLETEMSRPSNAARYSSRSPLSGQMTPAPACGVVRKGLIQGIRSPGHKNACLKMNPLPLGDFAHCGTRSPVRDVAHDLDKAVAEPRIFVVLYRALPTCDR
jgi:hypothetical protein